MSVEFFDRRFKFLTTSKFPDLALVIEGTLEDPVLTSIVPFPFLVTCENLFMYSRCKK